MAPPCNDIASGIREFDGGKREGFTNYLLDAR